MKTFYNVWNIFYIILASAFIVFTILLTFSFNSIKEKHLKEVSSYAGIIATSINTKLHENEVIFDLIGYELLVEKSHSTQKFKEVLDSLLTKCPYLAGFGIANIDGDLIASSSNIDISKGINLYEVNKENNDFNRSLTSKQMQIGRSYYFKPIKDWVIPLRKSIYDKEGHFAGVVTAGLNNSQNNNFFNSLELPKDKKMVLLLDTPESDKIYRIHYTHDNKIANAFFYKKPLPLEKFHTINEMIQKKYGFSIENMRSNGKTVTFIADDLFGVKNIVALHYDVKYKLWVLVGGKYSKVWDEFSELLLIYSILFAIVFVLFYLLFKNIANSEDRKKEELVFQAQHDILTHLPNRTYMYEHIQKWLQKHRKKYYVLYLDLDNFKNINDKYGHTIGDEILVEVARRLEGYFSKEDMVIRQGGDEFIILKEYDEDCNKECYFKDLITLVSEVYYVELKEFRIGMSVGIAKYPQDASKIEELLSLADTAMYAAKKQKNSYKFFSEDMRKNSLEKADIEQELRGALEREELWMLYQPQIDTNGALYGVEALIRWENKKLGFVGPEKFIGVAEDIGLMRELGKFIIWRSLTEIKAVQDTTGLLFGLSINVSVLQLYEEDFLYSLLEAIDSIGFDKHRLTIEITETQSLDNLDEVLPLLYTIRNEGIEISLDDFGTGYSSLSILRELPINELKIDKSFIDKILYDSNEKALIQSIISIGKNFDMVTLAEGVETKEQLEELRNIGCDIFQGYYHSKPISAHNLKVFIRRMQNDRR